MTKEQIRQNAVDRFPDSLNMQSAYREGAYSCSEEIEHKNAAIKELGKLCGQLLTENMNFRTEIDKLQNPWISVKDRLPDMFVDSNGVIYTFSIKVLVVNEKNPNNWHVAEYFLDTHDWCCLEHPTYIIDDVTHWMPVNTLKV